ncbi:hypothetical protein [Haloarcula marismortui]|uniref:Uncharacterized protein n=1 Tax=Haloarcula marismortui ATCC 33800 TaxID=662476 RepID=M0JXI7_9EURY|nr:hypothetical protein [Haloarcula sinaiiensis]EMA12330.1 hypothetical protein C436_14469 [Haloarcula sinaiiensis ATCC 33800]QUJ71269.1 hypothetical protein KDQ40_11150 [Haloarcula sinaiiensis ATCC 33800]
MADFSAPWEVRSEPTATATSLDEGDTVAAANSQTNGPLTARVETTGWTIQDLEVVLQVMNVLLFLIVVYMALTESN